MIPINRKEALRYMGFRNGAEPDSDMREQIDSCEKQLQESVRPKYVYKELPLTFLSEEPAGGSENVHADCSRMRIGSMEIESRALGRNLSGCRSVYLFAATLGLAPDRLIARAEVRKVSDAMIFQALSAAMAESFCNQANAELRALAAQKGLFTRPRFSPGYGDLSLEIQPDIIRILDASKAIGLTLTDTLLMMPSKSVTAIIGLSDTPSHNMREGCALCGRKDCSFRKDPATEDEQ